MAVDDEPDITSGIKGCLEDRFRVDEFNDPLEALASFQKGMYDAVLIDVKMPKMNGFELYKALYAVDQEPLYSFITAFEIRPAEFRMMFPRSKITHFLKKPFSASDLAELFETELSASP